jgi:uncharacterized protein
MMRQPLLVFTISLAISTTLVAEDRPAPLKVLFLGDRGHHRPADRAAQLIPVMAGRGIEITYTEKTADLNPETLGKYDALIVYANIDRIQPNQEKALLDYVAGGGGFVPLHCASYCFRNSPAYVALVGAQFLRHGTGEFDTKVTDPEHPIMKGLTPFRTWDETYVHTQHNTQDRQVLQTRAEGEGEEPWTWVRTQGKGRVFYTAYGHDARTFGNPGFHDLVERGIRWAAAKGAVFDSRPRVSTGLKPFTYTQAAGGIPVYLPGRPWGAQGEPLNRMQQPLAPAESVRHMALPRGFEAQLFAAEPEIRRPITMAWDHRGRLWIAESVDYPNDKRTDAKGNDRLTICEDTDGDGRADLFKVFAEGLNIPTSIAFARGGVIVHQAPETLFLKDTDGDDKADERRVLFSGWGTYDTHAGPSNLRWGLDNWIWGIVGYAGFRGKVGGETHSFRQGIYRFRPDGSKLEFLRSTSNNSWGLGFSEEGLVFGSTANACPSVYLPIPNRYYEAVRGASASGLEMISDSYRFFPVTANVRQVDQFGGFTAGAGHALYTARAYPPHYWNRTAFVAEPTGHLVATFTLQPHGTDFSSSNGWNLLASDDEWTAPIMAEVGPDGQVWVIDWYNYIVQHNPTPQGFKTGRGSAYETPLRDKTHGRIYRIVYRDSKATKPIRLDPADALSLLAGLKSDNQLWRMHAQRLLVERGQLDVVPELVKAVQDLSVDSVGLNAGAIHALWALQGLGALDGSNPEAAAATTRALTHPSAGVRRNALEVLPRDGQAAGRIMEAGSLADADPQVRLAALLALAELPSSETAASAIVRAIDAGAADDDRWLPDAITSAAAAHDQAFLAALARRQSDRPPGVLLLQVAGKVAEHYARGGPADSVGALVRLLPGAQAKLAEAMLAGLLRGWPENLTVRLDAPTEAALPQLLRALSLEGKGTLATLAERWGSRVLAPFVSEIAASLVAIVTDEQKPDADRIAAARQFVQFQKASVNPAQTLLDLITPRTGPALAAGFLEAISQSTSGQVGAALLERLPSLTPAGRAQALRSILARADWTTAFLNAVERGALRLDELSLDQKAALTRHRDRALASRARRLLARGGGLPDVDRQKVIDELAPLVLKGGDPARGKIVFKEQCAKCHTHSGDGGKVGPDLTGVAANPRSELLIHILDPSRGVEGNFVQYTVATNDGRVLNGLLASETKTSVQVLDAEGKEHVILRNDIEDLVASKKSLMPDGFEKQIPAQGFADLLAFLTQRGKFLPLDLRKAATIVSTQGMFYSKDAAVERLVFPDWLPKTFEGVPFQLVDPQGDRIPNVILLYGPEGAFPPKMPRSVSLPCNTAAKAIHFLSGVSGWGATDTETAPTVSMIVRLHYIGGTIEDHPLKNGVEFADYIRRVDVPGSKLAFLLGGRQVRYLAVHPRRAETIERIELVKGPDDTAPVVVAVTVEVAD